MVRSPFLRGVLFVSIAAIILFPLYAIFVQYPAFTKLLSENTTLQAERMATALSIVLLARPQELTTPALPADFHRHIRGLQKDSRIIKLKIFSPAGTIIYSTDPLEIGRINEEEYFQRILQTGDRRTQLIDKNTPTLEKQLLAEDVVEAYAPIVQGKRVLGVLEIYYDITAEKAKLHQLISRSTGTLFLLAVILLAAVVAAASKARSTMDERRRMADVMGESEKRYRTLFENAPDAIFILEGEGDQAGRIVAANKAVTEMHGYRRAELMTMKITDLDTDDSAEASPGLVRRIREGEWVKTELWHKKKDGTVFPVEVSAGPLDIGGHHYILAFDRDITARRGIERAREKLIKELRDAIEKIKTLKGLLPICSSCKKIRDDKGYWNQIEAYISAHTDADFSHGLCPDCTAKLYPRFRNDRDSGSNLH